MAGDEGKLRYELLDAARGVEPRSSAWKKEQGSEAYFSGAGSQNIWLMRFAVQTLRGFKTPWEAVYFYQLGAAGVFSASSPHPTIRPAFGGSEFLSLIYWPWHLMSHLALCRAQPQIAERARRWCALNWALLRGLQGPDGSLLVFGQRSAGHAPIPREIDWFFALASDGDVRRAEGWCKRAGVGLKRSWAFEIGTELKAEMRETWRESLAVTASDLEALPLRVSTEIVRTTEGLALVHARTANGNTPPILAGTLAKDGRREVLPTSVVKGARVPGGIRIRQRYDRAAARIEGGEIVYASSLYTGGAEQRIPLPGGDVVQHLRLGAVASGVAEEPPPTPTAEPLARAADLLAGLHLGKRQEDGRAAIVASLRRGEAPSAADLATIRSWFRPDSPQAQAAQWREAIAVIEGVG